MMSASRPGTSAPSRSSSRKCSAALQRRHLDGAQGIEPQPDGLVDVVVDVALGGDIGRELVVHAEQQVAGGQVFGHHAGDQVAQVALGGALADDHRHPHRQPLLHIFHRHALVVVGQPPGGVGFQVAPGQAGRMAVGDLAHGVRRQDFAQVRRAVGQHLRRVQLAQAHRPRPAQGPPHLGRPQHAAGGLQARRRGHARRDFHEQPVGQAVGRAEKFFQAVVAGHVGHFHRVHQQRGRAGGHHHLGQPVGRQQGDLDVDVGVDKPGRA